MTLKIAQLLSANTSIFFKYSVQEFLKSYAADYHDAGRKLLVGIIGQSQVFSVNLISAERRYYKDDRNKMVRYYVGLITQLAKAVQVEM